MQGCDYMDIVKIGKFISLCRKEKGLTQKGLGEKLGVSDKAVSKWERGIHLPDASLYYPLCEVLDISINELFAGEHLSKEESIIKTEENIVSVLKENNDKNKILNIIRIISICIVPLIFLQWRINYLGDISSLGYFVSDVRVYQFVNLHYVSILYVIAYLMIYRKVKLGYYLIWVIYIILFIGYMVLWNVEASFFNIIISIDFCSNIILMIIGIINKEIHSLKLIKRS